MTMKFDPKELLWEQRYRPQTLADCVLPESTKKIFQSMIDCGEISNMLLSSYCPGTGKTTVALALMNDMNYEYMFLAAGTGSGEGGIQAMRDIESYAGSLSLEGKKKAVIIDEADNLTDDAQKALRNIIERYSKTVRFILTANYPENIMDPLRKSRLTEYVFEIKESDKKSMLQQMIKRCAMICKNEGVVVESVPALAALAKHCYPDNRDLVKRLHTYARSGKIDEGIIATLSDGADVEPILEALRGKQFKTLRELAPQYKHNLNRLLIELYRKGFQFVDKSDPANVAAFIQIIGEANNNAARCADVEILIVYMLVDLMMNCRWQ